MKLRYLAFGGLCAWAVFGTPNSDLAGLFWGKGPAPWESVDAFYYPNRHNLSVHRAAHNVGSLDGCRAWVRKAARADADPALTRGDYECGVGKLEPFGGMTVYRITVR
jgi:hypothetical protein